MLLLYGVFENVLPLWVNLVSLDLSTHRRVAVCVCVNPWAKGFLPPLQPPLSTHSFTGRGQQGIHSSAANEDSCGHSVKQIGTPICVPAGKLLSKLSNPPCLFHGGCMSSSHKQVSHRADLQPLCRCALSAVKYTNHFVKTPTLLRTFHLSVPSPFSTWELSVTEYNCRSVFRSAVPLGC